MSNEITDPKAREQAEQVLASLRAALSTAYSTGLLSRAERDLITAVEVRLAARLGKRPAADRTAPGRDLVRYALAEIEREASTSAETSVPSRATCTHCGLTILRRGDGVWFSRGSLRPTGGCEAATDGKHAPAVTEVQGGAR